MITLSGLPYNMVLGVHFLFKFVYC